MLYRKFINYFVLNENKIQFIAVICFLFVGKGNWVSQKIARTPCTINGPSSWAGVGVIFFPRNFGGLFLFFMYNIFFGS